MTARLSSVAVRRFVETLSAEIGAQTFVSVLSKSGLPREWSDPLSFTTFDDNKSAQAYDRLQSALRTYYGRGARGILLRVGANLWRALLEDATLWGRAQAALIQRLPKSLRIKPALELMARLFASEKGGISLHSLDLDLLLVDRTSPHTQDQSDTAPICFVTLGLIRECLYWADGREHDVEERTCRGMGDRQCEFKISM